MPCSSSPNDGFSNTLWRTDGTSNGTVLVKQVRLSSLVEMDGKLYFTSTTGLWTSDGTSVGTVLVHPSGVIDFPPVPLQHRLYFLGSSGRLWTSDGTTAGTTEIADAPLGFRTPLVTNGNRLFFGAARGPFSTADGLWTLSPADPVVDDLVVLPGPMTTKVQAVVLTDGGSPVTERGFLYSETNPTPEVAGPDVTKVAVAGALGPMSASLTGLKSSAPFFVRAFAATANGVGYDSAMFVTPVIHGPALSISDVSMNEGYSGSAKAVFTVTLSEPSAETVTVFVLVSNQSATAGSDYLDPGPQTVTFGPGETVKLVEVAVLGDAGLEEDETFLVTLSIPLHATLLDGLGVGGILNDDLASRVFVAYDGSDTAECWIKTTPCRTIAGALNQTAVDGEVIIVTSGEYASVPLLIDKGVKVTAATGATALIRQPISLNAPAGRVVLRGLTLKGTGTGNALTIAAADSLSCDCSACVDGCLEAIV